MELKAKFKTQDKNEKNPFNQELEQEQLLKSKNPRMSTLTYKKLEKIPMLKNKQNFETLMPSYKDKINEFLHYLKNENIDKHGKAHYERNENNDLNIPTAHIDLESLEKFLNDKTKSLLLISKVLSENFRLSIEVLESIICYDLTDETIYSDKIVDNSVLMRFLAYLFYIQRKFLISPAMYIITSDNLIGNKREVNPIHNHCLKNYKNSSINLISYYTTSPFSVYGKNLNNFRNSNSENNNDYEETYNSYVTNKTLEYNNDLSSKITKIKLSKKSIITQCYLLFSILKKCNIKDTQVLISEYFQLVKIILKIIKSVNNKVDFDFVKNVCISIEYIKQRYNFKILDNDLYDLLIQIIDTSLFEFNNFTFLTEELQRKQADQKIHDFESNLGNGDNSMSAIDVNEINLENEANINNMNDTNDNKNFSFSKIAAKLKPENIKKYIKDYLGVKDNKDYYEATLKYYNFDEEKSMLHNNYKKYKKYLQDKNKNKEETRIATFTILDNDNNEDYGGNGSFTNKIDYLLYKFHLDENIFYTEKDTKKEENCDPQDDEDENIQDTGSTEKSVELKLELLIKLMTKALLATDNYKIYTNDFIINNKESYFQEIEKHIDYDLIINKKVYEENYHKLLHYNEERENKLSQQKQKLNSIFSIKNNEDEVTKFEEDDLVDDKLKIIRNHTFDILTKIGSICHNFSVSNFFIQNSNIIVSEQIKSFFSFNNDDNKSNRNENNNIWLQFKELLDYYSVLFKELKNYRTLKSKRQLNLIRIFIIRSGVLKFIQNLAEFCFINYSLVENKYFNSLIESLSSFVYLIFKDEPFFISIMLKKCIFNLNNDNIKDMTYFYSNDFDLITSYKLFANTELLLVKDLVKTIFNNIYKLSYNNYFEILFSSINNKHLISDFTLKKQKYRHKSAIFVANGIKKITDINKNYVTANKEYLNSVLFDKIILIKPSQEYSDINKLKEQGVDAEQKEIIYNYDNDLKVDRQLAVTLYKLIKNITKASCNYDLGDLHNNLISFFSGFLDKYLNKDFKEIQDLNCIILQDQHQTAELTVLMIGIMDQLPEDSTMILLDKISIPFLQKLLYWLEEEQKDYNNIKYINFAIFRKLLLKHKEKTIQINNNNDESNSNNQIITVYSVSDFKKEDLNENEVQIKLNTYVHSQKKQGEKRTLQIENQEQNQNMINIQNCHIYLEEKNVEKYLYGEFLINIINDFSFYLSLQKQNEAYCKQEISRVEKLQDIESQINLISNNYEIINNIIFHDYKDAINYLQNVIWEITVKLLKTIIYISPSITPILIKYFNKNLVWFLKGLKFFFNYYKEKENLSESNFKDFTKKMFSDNFYGKILREIEDKKEERKREILYQTITLLVEIIDEHIRLINKLNDSNIEKSIGVFRFYLEIIKSKYVKNDFNKKNSVYECSKEYEQQNDLSYTKKTCNSILSIYNDNNNFCFEVQSRILVSDEISKYMNNFRRNICNDLHNHLLLSAKVLPIHENIYETDNISTDTNNNISDNNDNNMNNKQKSMSLLDTLSKHDIKNTKVNKSTSYYPKYTKQMTTSIKKIISKSNNKEIKIDIYSNEILKGSSQLKLFNIIFKIDPTPIQEYFLKEKKEYISVLIKGTILNLRKIMTKSFFSINFKMNKKSILVSSFIEQLEFLRLLCENHNKLYQYIVVKYDPRFLPELLSFTTCILQNLNSNFQNYKLLNVSKYNKEVAVHAITKSYDLKNYLGLVNIFTFNSSDLKILQLNHLNENFGYTDKVCHNVFDFLIEIIQGSSISTFEFMFSSNLLNFIHECSELRKKIMLYCSDYNYLADEENYNNLLDQSEVYSNNIIKLKHKQPVSNYPIADFLYKTSELKFYNDFIRFSSQLLEENNLPLKYKQEITNNFNDNLMLSLIKSVYKKIIYMNLITSTILDEKEDNKDYYNNDTTPISQLLQRFELGKGLENMTKEELTIFKYYLSKDFLLDEITVFAELQNTFFFQLFIRLGLFIKNSFKYKNQKETIESKVNIISKRESNVEGFFYKQTIYLMENLIERVEINYKDSIISSEMIESFYSLIREYLNDNNENNDLINIKEEELRKSNDKQLKEVFFAKPSDCFYLTSKDIKKMVLKTKLDDSKQRLIDLLEDVPNLLNTIDTRKKINEYENTHVLFKNCNSLNFKNMINYSLVISIVINILLVAYSGNTMINVTRTSTLSSLNPYSDYINYLGKTQIAFLVICLCIWFYVNSVVSKIEINKTEKECSSALANSNNLKNSLNKIYVISNKVFHNLHDNTEVLLLFWNLIFGILALYYPVFYSFQLLSLIFVVDVMKTVMSAFLVNDRYKQFLAMGLMIFITLIMYSFIMFFFYQDSFNSQNETNNEIENSCEHPFMCFLTLLNQALRTGEGPNLGIKNSESPGFWADLAITWTFYFLLILIMISIINGIIVDAFQQLRSEKNTQNQILVNSCLVCDLNSTSLEVDGKNFLEHYSKYHSIEKYMNYLVKILTTNKLDLNSIETMVYEKYLISDISFFPIKDYYK